jgi:hypothetical protein
MITIILIGLIFILITIGLIYLILFFPTKWLIKKDKQKRVRLVLSIVIGLLVTVYYLFVPAATNNKTATIANFDNQYIVTVSGKRSLMVHDPISLFERKTYLETYKIIVPRAEGIVNGQEITTQPGYYKFKGTMTFEKEHLIIDLWADNYDNKTKDPLSWNGKYRVKWKNKN